MPGPLDDAWVLAAATYLRAPTAHAERRHPTIAAAHRLFDRGGVIRDEVEARLLAGELFDVVAAKAGVPADVVDAYAALFFDVTDAGAGGALDWLLFEAVEIGAWIDRPPTERECWAYAALAGGPVLVDVLVADHLGRAEPRLPDRPLLAAKARHLALAHAAALWPGSYDLAAIVEVEERLFANKLERLCADSPLLALQVEFVKKFVTHPQRAAGDDVAGQRSAREENHHGRESSNSDHTDRDPTEFSAAGVAIQHANERGSVAQSRRCCASTDATPAIIAEGDDRTRAARSVPA